MMKDRGKYVTVLLVAALVAGLDQFTKYLICKLMPLYSRIEVLKGYLDIIHIRNTGIAFGLFKDIGAQYKALSIVAVGAVAIFLLFFLLAQIKKEQKLQMMGLSLILGGAAGNLIDRIRLGEVIDFIDAHWRSLYHWPAFNAADAAISIGITIMLVDELIKNVKHKNVRRET